MKNIMGMALKDLKKQYSGTIMGVTWAVLKNLIFIFAYWFATAIGLKNSAQIDYPYIAWLVAGLSAWFVIKDTLVPAANSIRKNKYLVTKIVFPVSTIPTFKVVASIFSNILFTSVVMIFLMFSGIFPKIYWLQIIYYQFAVFVLLTGVSLISSALVVFSKDIQILLTSTIFLLFWLSPILYPITNLSKGMSFVLKLNPFYYIVEGFRNSFVYNIWFWEQPLLTAYFWIFAITTLLVGCFVHCKLRDSFADIL